MLHTAHSEHIKGNYMCPSDTVLCNDHAGMQTKTMETGISETSYFSHPEPEKRYPHQSTNRTFVDLKRLHFHVQSKTKIYGLKYVLTFMAIVAIVLPPKRVSGLWSTY